MIGNFRMEQDLDKYVEMFEIIYEPIQNRERDFYMILARLLESIAKCSQYINKASEKGIADNLPTVFSWYCSLVSRAKLENSITDILWKKFPGVCPYCVSTICRCPKNRRSLEDNCVELEKTAKGNINDRPRTLNKWQEMFADIYPRDPQGYDQKSNFAHLIEELGETSEAFRIRYFRPTAIENELSDVFTWILGMANLLDSRAKDNSIPPYNRYLLAEQVFAKYPGVCSDCKHSPCSCVSPLTTKISEVIPPSPEDIKIIVEKVLSESGILETALLSHFETLESQKFFTELRNVSRGVEITNEKLNELIEKLITNPEHKKWYQEILPEIPKEIIMAIMNAIIRGGLRITGI